MLVNQVPQIYQFRPGELTFSKIQSHLGLRNARENLVEITQVVFPRSAEYDDIVKENHAALPTQAC